MKNIKLNNGVEMPMIGFGTFQITDPEQCEKSVLTAIHAGYRLIDTAEAYGNEKYVGNAVRKCGIARDELFLTTKLNFNHFETETARETINRSLENLQTDYIDLVLLHWGFGNRYSAWRVLEEFYEQGKIRAIGVSNFEPDMLIDLIRFNKVTPAVNQIETHLYCQRKSTHAWENKYGIAHQAYAPLGQGKANDMFAEKAVVRLAEKYGKTPAQILLRYQIENGVIVIPKSVHESRIKENIDIFDFPLTKEELESLAALDKNEPMIGRPEDPDFTEFATTWIK